MATSRQCADFASHVLNTGSLLDDAIEWIKANISPGNVFGDGQLAEHVRNNVEIDEVYSERNILSYVAGTFSPREVFDTKQLEAWAEDNGYTKE